MRGCQGLTITLVGKKNANQAVGAALDRGIEEKQIKNTKFFNRRKKIHGCGSAVIGSS